MHKVKFTRWQIMRQGGFALAMKAVYSKPVYRQHCTIPESLGCELTDHVPIKVDMLQKTSIDGIFACGDTASMMRSVAML